MQNRRDFLKTISIIGSGLVLNSSSLARAGNLNTFFGLNDFIENHPDAVFILRTQVDSKTNSTAILNTGRQLASTLFQLKSDPIHSYPLNSKVVFKPNITWWSWDITPYESTMGIQTDTFFVEGLIQRLKDISIQPENIYIRDANYHGAASIDGKGFAELAARTNTNIKDLSGGVGVIDNQDIQWSDVQNGLYFKRLPFVWPINASDSCLINVAKLKSHSMGMTLCSKNLQGAVTRPYVAHCSAFNKAINGVSELDVIPGAFSSIQENYTRHKNQGVPRWEVPGDESGGIWMETWASRCLDNNSVLKPMINILEGIYSREGSFVSGPNNGYGRDFLTNIIIFGKNAFHVDIIGTYLAGHEPGNFGLFHMAKERGLSNFLNPLDIPVYDWTIEGNATRQSLTSYTRTPIRTPYLQKPGEEQYHLVNEPFIYTAVSQPPKNTRKVPDVFAVSQNFPNPFNPSTSIRYYIPTAGSVLLEVYDIRGARVAVLTDGYMNAGEHQSVWNSTSFASGTYLYRLSFNGTSITKKMILIK